MVRLRGKLGRGVQTALVLGVMSWTATAATLRGNFTGIDGTPHTAAELRGRFTVVNLWATWCGPCKAEMPLLDQLAREYAAHEVNFVAISIDDKSSEEKIPAFVDALKLKMPVWKGATTTDLQNWSNDGVVPATLILDQQGTVLMRLIGQVRQAELRERLDWMLAGRPGKKPQMTVKHL